MRKRYLLANRDTIFGVRARASSIEPCIQVSCSCGQTALAPIPASERGKPYVEKDVLGALPPDERDAMASFQMEHGLVGHDTKVELVLMGV